MEDVGIGILWPFGTFYGYLAYFSHFGMLYVPKNLATLIDRLDNKADDCFRM
jgi:hypothetical protein